MSFISNKSLEQADNEVFSIIEGELKRQTNHLEMIASENFTSPAVMQTMGSIFTNKYAEGYPYKRYYGLSFPMSSLGMHTKSSRYIDMHSQQAGA